MKTLGYAVAYCDATGKWGLWDRLYRNRSEVDKDVAGHWQTKAHDPNHPFVVMIRARLPRPRKEKR